MLSYLKMEAFCIERNVAPSELLGLSLQATCSEMSIHQDAVAREGVDGFTFDLDEQ
jgi:hypothetical protein